MIRAMGPATDPSLRHEQVERTGERILDAAVALPPDEAFTDAVAVLADRRSSSAERALTPLLDGLPRVERRRAVAVVYGLHSVGLVIDDLERCAQQRKR